MKDIVGFVALLTIAGLGAWQCRRSSTVADDGPCPPPVCRAVEDDPWSPGRVAGPDPQRDAAATALDRRELDIGPGATPTAVDAGSGFLIVHAFWSDDLRPAANAELYVRRDRADLSWPPGPAECDGSREACRFGVGPSGTSARIRLAPGRVALQRAIGRSGRPTDAGRIVERLEVRAGEVRHVRVLLAPHLSVEGIVLDEAGAPIQGVEFHARGYPFEQFVPAGWGAPDGRFRLRFENTYAVFFAVAPGRVRSGQVELMHLDRSVPLEIRLHIGGRTLRGRVRNLAGQGVGRVMVSIARDGRDDSSSSMLTNGSGAFELPGSPLGRVRVSAIRRGPGKYGFSGTSVEVDVGPVQPASIEIVLVGWSSLAGTVRGPVGAPVAGATVELRDSAGRRRAEVTSGADGRYRVLGIVPGAYSVDVKVADQVCGSWCLRTPGEEQLVWDLRIAGRPGVATTPGAAPTAATIGSPRRTP